MIEIEQPSTPLSIEKTAKLLEKLVDMRSKKSVRLPDIISKNVDKLLSAQRTFVKEIDNYLHKVSSFKDEDDSIETISTVVQTCPEFLATVDENGSLPCLFAASAAIRNYFMLFAHIGHQYNIGGKCARGGLLYLNYEGENALQCIEDIKVFDELQNHNPPLFFKKDIRRYKLLHNAVEAESLQIVKYMCNIDPSCLNQRDDFNGLPIHRALVRLGGDDGLKIVQYFLQESVSQSVLNETIGGLFTTMPYGHQLGIDLLVERWGRQEAWDCIERAL